MESRGNGLQLSSRHDDDDDIKHNDDDDEINQKLFLPGAVVRLIFDFLSRKLAHRETLTPILSLLGFFRFRVKNPYNCLHREDTVF